MGVGCNSGRPRRADVGISGLVFLLDGFLFLSSAQVSHFGLSALLPKVFLYIEPARQQLLIRLETHEILQVLWPIVKYM